MDMSAFLVNLMRQWFSKFSYVWFFLICLFCRPIFYLTLKQFDITLMHKTKRQEEFVCGAYNAEEDRMCEYLQKFPVDPKQIFNSGPLIYRTFLLDKRNIIYFLHALHTEKKN